MSAITIGGNLVHYEVLGRGRPVILLHTWVGSWRYWIPTMQQLQLKYRVYAIDLFGFGDSGKDASRYSVDHQVHLIVDFMNNLGIPKAALVGHGLGALVATEFARLYPDKAPRVLLSGAPLFDPGNLDKRVPAGRLTPLTDNRPAAPVLPQLEPEATIMNASSAMRAALLEAARARSNGDPEPEVPDLTIETARRVQRHNPLQTLIGDTNAEALLAKCFKRSEPEYDKLALDLPKIDNNALKVSAMAYDSGRMLDTLRLLPMPMVVLHGSDDPIIPVPDENVWHYITAENTSLLPMPLPGVRHFPMLEYERFIRLVNDFLDAADVSKLEIKERWKRRTR
ncbi:MAG: alpha/beta hydrolase [Chloroflexi bacterium]|nr:alpha/beta hydrolase [Chloroflexota bacterium]